MPVCEMGVDGNIIAINSFGPSGLISRHEGENHYFYTFDPLGHVCQIQNASGTVTTSAGYTAYGTPLAASEANPTPFGYGGQAGYYTDSETNLILCSARYYDPSQGRWLTRDPIGYDGGLNVYAYCGGNPIGRLDPSGLKASLFEQWQSGELGRKIPILGGLAQQAGCDYAKWEMGKGSGWQAAWSCGKAAGAIVVTGFGVVVGAEYATGLSIAAYQGLSSSTYILGQWAGGALAGSAATMGARYLSILPSASYAYSWTANRLFMTLIYMRPGTTVYFGNDPTQAGGTFAKEVQWLAQRGAPW